MFSKKQQKIINLLGKIAEDIQEPLLSQHAAAIIIGNEIVGLGVNSKKSDPFAAKYGRNKYCIYQHAETSAIKNAIRRIGLQNLLDSRATLYVVRRKFDWDSKMMIFGNSKPCEGCARAIELHGIKKVIWTN